jgi:hypothetical protein
VAQNLRQLVCAELTRSTGAVAQTRQTWSQLLAVHVTPPFSSPRGRDVVPERKRPPLAAGRVAVRQASKMPAHMESTGALRPVSNEMNEQVARPNAS